MIPVTRADRTCPDCGGWGVLIGLDEFLEPDEYLCTYGLFDEAAHARMDQETPDA